MGQHDVDESAPPPPPTSGGRGRSLDDVLGLPAGPSIRKGGTMFSPRTRSPYTERDALEIGKWTSPEKIAEVQRKLRAANMIPANAKIVNGRADPVTIAAFRELLEHANALGKPWEKVLEDYASYPTAKDLVSETMVIGGRVGGGNVYPIALTDPAALRAMTDKVARAVYGRKVTDEQRARITAALSGAEEDSARMLAGARETAERRQFDATTASEEVRARAQVDAVAGTGPNTGPSTIISPVPGVRTPADTMGAARSGHRKHKGTDIFGAKGSPAVAPIGGTVVQAGDSGGLGGKRVWIKGDDGRFHYLAHLDRVDVKPGQKIAQGAPIGTVGNSGNARNTPAHIHYSINSKMGSEDGIGNPAVELARGTRQIVAPTATEPAITAVPNQFLPSQAIAYTEVDPDARAEEMLRAERPDEALGHDLTNVYEMFSQMIGGQR